MTRLTEQYLLNYLQKKSLTMAASQEVNEASNLGYLMGSEHLRLKVLRKAHAITIADKCRADESAAFEAYMTHLQEMSAGGP